MKCRRCEEFQDAVNMELPRNVLYLLGDLWWEHHDNNDRLDCYERYEAWNSSLPTYTTQGTN